MPNPMIPNVRWSALTRHPPSYWPRPGRRSRPGQDFRCGRTTNTGGRVPATCSWPASPLAGWRHVAVTQRRTMTDFAQQMRWLADEAYPEAEVVRVVLDNLNTHRRASLYETFPAEEARRIAGGWSSTTPQARSWLNMAEIEFSVLSRSCLKQRLSGEEASGGKSMLWSRSATPPEPPSTGGSTPGTHEPNCTAFTLPILRLTEY